MRLLVGTLYTSENEFEECCRAIENQTYTDYHHEIIRNLPKKMAHETLYKLFMDNKDEFDLLIKVDADMVIEDPELFKKIVSKFKAENDLDLLLIAVQDFFTDELLIGMNIFKNTVRWNLGKEELFTDMTYDKKSIRKVRKDFNDLAPAALHCSNPSNFQSFHYGFHRGMKAYRGGTNWRVLKSLFHHYRRNPDTRLAVALLGANEAFSGRFTVQNISYNNKELHSYYKKKFNGIETGRYDSMVRKTKIYRILNLPIHIRYPYWYYRLKSKLFKNELS